MTGPACRRGVWLLVFGMTCMGVTCIPTLAAQEANSGFDLRASLSGQFAASGLSTQDPRDGSPETAGFRSVLYPTWKIDSSWAVTAALQFYTRPYFFEDLSSAGYGAKGEILQASLNYSHVSGNGSILVRAGELSTSFGSFLLRYDDADNPVVDLPIEYGYYYSPVSTLPVAGAQVDATRGKWDARAQFANSSPTNPRSLFAHDQYGNWAGGAGYTIRQGLRVGISAFRGPYLDRQYKFFHLGEANPNTLPAHAVGVDAALTRRHSSLLGEAQSFVLPYTVTPTVHDWAGYFELKQVLSPRWYVAARNGYLKQSTYLTEQSLEAAAGFRPNRFQIVKVDYEFRHLSSGEYRTANTLAIQVVTSFHKSAALQ
jgi:hypothetical protein